MINPVGHSNTADPAEQTRTHAKPQSQKTRNDNQTAGAQDSVTLKNSSDADHDGDTK